MLYELRDKLCKELEDYAKGDLSAGSLDVVDKLAHTIKNLDRIIEGGYSGRSYARRDRMGRYSRAGLADRLRDLMDEAPDDHARTEIQRLIDKM